MAKKINFGSWKTATGGGLAFVTLVIVGLSLWNSRLTGQPVDIDKLLIGLTSFATAIVGIFGRDNDKSSQDVGIK